MNRPYTAILIVPTGVGAAIGGYAGDAIPVARTIAQVCDRLITHPNVLNGASLYWNILSQKRCQIITVRDNQTHIQVPAQSLGIKAIHINSYLLLFRSSMYISTPQSWN